MVGGVHSQYNQIPYPPGGWPKNWKIIISQRFSHRSESSELHVRLPSLGVWNQEEESPDHLALKASKAWFQDFHRSGINRNSTLGGCTQGLMCTRNQGKGSDFKGARVRHTCWSWRVSWESKGWLWLTRNKDTGGRGTGKYSLAWALLEATILTPRPGPTQQPAGSSAGTSQAKQSIGLEHSTMHQQTGCLKSSWVHRHI